VKNNLTDAHKKAMDKKAKLARMAEKKAAYEATLYSDSLDCRFHGFLQVNCKVCIANLKQRLGQTPAPAPPKE